MNGADFGWAIAFTRRERRAYYRCAESPVNGAGALDESESILKCAAHSDACPADLDDPLTMPANLTKAPTELDRAVDACYCARLFDSDRERVEFLFALYERLTAGLKEPRRKRKN